MRKYRCRQGRGSRRGVGRGAGFSMRGRPLKEIIIEEFPEIQKLIPQPKLSNEQLTLTIGEYEALRLVDLEGLSQEEAGELMNVSRGTIWRLLDSGRKKMVRIIIEGKVLEIERPIRKEGKET